MSKPILTGGCACGAVRYEVAARPLMMFRCHCRDCQRVSGSAFTAALLFPQKHFRLTHGDPRYHELPSVKGGFHTRGFCADCGSRLFGAVDPESKFIGITATSLDDPGIFEPQMDFFMADAQPWDRPAEGLPAFDEYPPPPKAS